MENIRIEEVGDINYDFPYLEVFIKGKDTPFLEVSITEEGQLLFTIFQIESKLALSLLDWEFILSTSKKFKTNVIKNENDFLASKLEMDTP